MSANVTIETVRDQPLQQSRSAAQLLMDRETRVSYGPVPHGLGSDELAEMKWQLVGDEFLLRAAGRHYFHYRRGEAVRVERGQGADISEESLWLNGSVYAAVASINGLLPIHASAVAFEGKVFAFTGPAGAGKSTLTAALGRCGLPMFCDDTLILDLSDPDRITCLPGHKRLKLAPEAIELTGAAAVEKVSRTIDKLYAVPAAGHVRATLPLAELIVLEWGREPSITPTPYAERFVRLQDDHQTARLFAAARRFNRTEQFAHLARLAEQITMNRLVRPTARCRFEESLALIAEHIRTTRC